MGHFHKCVSHAGGGDLGFIPTTGPCVEKVNSGEWSPEVIQAKTCFYQKSG